MATINPALIAELQRRSRQAPALNARRGRASRDAFLAGSMLGGASGRSHPMAEYLLRSSPGRGALGALGDPSRTPAEHGAWARARTPGTPEFNELVLRDFGGDYDAAVAALAPPPGLSPLFDPSAPGEAVVAEALPMALDITTGVGPASRAIDAMLSPRGLWDAMTAPAAPGGVSMGGTLVPGQQRIMPSEADPVRGADVGPAPIVEGPVFSSRRPSTKDMSEAAFEAERAGAPLTVDFDEWLQTPPAQTAAERFKANPYIRTTARKPESVLRQVADLQAENLLDIYDRVDPAIRERSARWYGGANRAAADRAERYGLPIENVAGGYAALSPQKDWFQNLEFGDRMLDILSRQGELEWTPEMTDTVVSGRVGMNTPAAIQAYQNIRGRPMRDINASPELGLWTRIYDQTYNTPHYRIVDPEGYKGDWARAASGAPMAIQWGSLGELTRAVDALRAANPQDVSRALGRQHKVRSFGSNISNPMDPRYATADTHAVAAGLLRPLGGAAPEVLQNFGGGVTRSQPGFEEWMGGVGSHGATGYGGAYPVTQRGMELAAAERGVLPREMQSITWEAARNLFENQKSAARQEVAANIWRDVARRRMTPAAARQAIVDEFGGGSIPVPAWAPR